MRNILSIAVGELIRLPVNVFKAIVHQLLFPPPRKKPEERLRLKVKGQFSIIRRQQDELSYQTIQLGKQGHELNDLKQLLSLKDKELDLRETKIKSLELRLSDYNHLN